MPRVVHDTLEELRAKEVALRKNVDTAKNALQSNLAKQRKLLEDDLRRQRYALGAFAQEQGLDLEALKALLLQTQLEAKMPPVSEESA